PPYTLHHLPPLALLSFFLMIRPPPRSPLFPYTTLFRSLYPYVVLPAVAAFKAIDASVEEAAQNLGAPRGRTLRTVILPLALPSIDRKSTRLNSSHQIISYAVFCLKKKKKQDIHSTNKTR